METKYETHWSTATGRHLILEEMETNHLLNCYKHILNNFGFYIDGFLSNYNLSQREAEQSVHDMRTEFKTELITRGLSDDEIENWSEEKWKIGIK